MGSISWPSGTRTVSGAQKLGSISEDWVGREDGEELGSPSKSKFLSKFKLTVRTRERHRGPYGTLPDVCHICLYLSLLPGGGLPIIKDREREAARGSSPVFLLTPVSQIVPRCGHHYFLTVILVTSLNFCLFLQIGVENLVKIQHLKN